MKIERASGAKLEATFEEFKMSKSFTLYEMLVLIAVLSIVLLIALPNLLGSRMLANEATAIGSLRQLNLAQTFALERDSDGDGVRNYVSLSVLIGAKLVSLEGNNASNATGVVFASGYAYECEPSSSQALASTRWCAVTNPASFAVTGNRAFCINQSGLISVRTTSAIALVEMQPDCDPPLDTRSLSK
jgi:type IV pilus assembly protein PilA